MRVMCILIFISSLYSMWGAILTVDNNIPSSSQYTTLQAAHDVAASGDTIYVLPSNGDYVGINITKQINIIGVGWIPQGLNGYMIKKTSISGTMCFSTGSDNSTIEGFGGFFDLQVYTTNLVAKMCMIRYLTLTSSCQSLLFMCNYLDAGRSSIINSVQATFTLYNNVFTNFAYQYIFSSSLNSNCYVINNTFKPYQGTFSNVVSGGNSYATASIMNNIIPAPVTLNSNIIYNIIGSQALNCIDATYHTVDGSAAIDSGNPNIAFNDLNGSRNDCGAYGGPTPFIDGGIPGYPAIYEINGPGVVTPNETIDIQIKAKTNRD